MVNKHAVNTSEWSVVVANKRKFVAVLLDLGQMMCQAGVRKEEGLALKDYKEKETTRPYLNLKSGGHCAGMKKEGEHKKAHQKHEHKEGISKAFFSVETDSPVWLGRVVEGNVKETRI